MRVFPNPFQITRGFATKSLLFGVFTFLLYLIAQYEYLIYHSFAELFSIAIACGIFMIAWNSRAFYNNNYLLFIGITYLFVALFDTLHTLAYQGMGVFKGYDDKNLPPQLWLISRYMESISLVIAPLFFRRKLQTGKVFVLFSTVSIVAIWSIFFARIFPICFVTGLGLTPFKRGSEYVIDLILVAALVLLHREKTRFDPKVLQLLSLSILCTIVVELFFTFYISLYGFSNFVGHIFKILAFGFMYMAIIKTALEQPYSLLFRELKQSEDALRQKEESLQLAQSLAHLGSWEWNLKDNSMWWSDEMYNLLDYEKGVTTPSLEQNMDRVHPDDMNSVSQIINNYLREKQPFKLTHRIVRTNGAIRYVAVEFNKTHLDQTGTAEVAMGIVHDITDQVMAEKLREDIEHVTRHDLKTPLNPIINIPELLLAETNFTPEQIEWIQLIRTSGYRMLDIIDSSLSLYRMEQGTYILTPIPFNMVQLITNIVRESAKELDKKRLRLLCSLNGAPVEVGDTFTLNSEELLCYTMLSNLIKNAVEASPTDAEITVSCDQDETWNLIGIHNRGAVPEKIRSVFFDKYITQGKKAGTGLGTYSALLSARTLKGDISMTTSEDAGTLITVCLPKTA